MMPEEVKKNLFIAEAELLFNFDKIQVNNLIILTGFL